MGRYTIQPELNILAGAHFDNQLGHRFDVCDNRAAEILSETGQKNQLI